MVAQYSWLRTRNDDHLKKKSLWVAKLSDTSYSATIATQIHIPGSLQLADKHIIHSNSTSTEKTTTLPSGQQNKEYEKRASLAEVNTG